MADFCKVLWIARKGEGEGGMRSSGLDAELYWEHKNLSLTKLADVFSLFLLVCLFSLTQFSF